MNSTKNKELELLKTETARILKSIEAISSSNPELIIFLNEIPLSSNEIATQKINLNDLKAYNDSLRFLLKNYLTKSMSSETKSMV